MRDAQRYRDAERRLWESVGAAPDERFVRLPTVGTEVRVLEVGEGPPALFVHGTTAGATSWATLVAALEGRRCLLLDRPGCGLSEPLDPRWRGLDGFTALADTLVADVLAGLGLDDVDVVATSLGGWLALRSAASQPERFRRLALVACPIGAPVDDLPIAMRLAAVPGLGRLLAGVPPTRGAVVAMLRQIGLGPAIADGRMSAAGVDWYHSLLRDTYTMRNELATAGGGALRPIKGLHPDLLLDDELLERVTVPTLLVWGDADVFGGADTARAFAPRLPEAQLELLPGLGHAPWMDDPRAVADALDPFLTPSTGRDA